MGQVPPNKSTTPFPPSPSPRPALSIPHARPLVSMVTGGGRAESREAGGCGSGSTSTSTSIERSRSGATYGVLSHTMPSSSPRSSPARRAEPGPSPSPTPSCTAVALRSLLAADLQASRRLGVCAGERSAWGSARPLLRLLEVSGHGVPWLAGTLYGLGRSESPAGREVLLNLLFALVLDIVLVAVVKGLVRRRRPTYNKMDMFVTISVDKYSFPSGHATRAAMVCRFVLHHLVLAIPLRVLVVLWAFIVGLSRVMLGRHNVTDVVFGFIMGYMQYSLVKYFWLSPLSAPTLFAIWNQ
uniref:Polyisoprenoid diphosphate/phosphate phosphohydrolase PLPP6 n=1 Tax=Pelusios castaneus TaxID=367368 RepID=A0A8C8VMG8_9SAUR